MIRSTLVFTRSSTADARKTRTRGVLSGVSLIAAAGFVLVSVAASPGAEVMAEPALSSEPRPGQELGEVTGAQASLVRDTIVVHTPTPTPTPEPVPAAASAAASGSTARAAVRIPTVAAPDPGSAQAIARQMVLARGWGEDQYSCLYRLWEKESNWNVYAQNRSSGAYGIPQALPGSKMATAGADWQTNAATQITWGLGYISGRYGTPCGAWAHSQQVGWY
ncbi:lytic transglycosylase domain-containing protein [Agrococcus sp. HG114]|uniref:aggregation-promoting factor C-terminal-like domain-containing protein n=1 Tax=Agrococcus sp. HG114 TaxID=2969757 RepID=UPI00215A34BB|nr:lytic transglycosylase domain-containing protein [Agrococcus sp. HG114]MCR8671152.1 lytic transglycosylase domain-containing protein [Agrococcus sp. HG114]